MSDDPGWNLTIGPSEHGPSLHVEPQMWWLSFVDTDKSLPRDQQTPGGGGFLGVSIVPGCGFLDAVSTASALGCNPGGEVQGLPLVAAPDAKWVGRLLSMADIESLEGEGRRNG